MTDNVDNLIIEHLKAIRNELRDFRQEAREEFGILKMRINSLERVSLACMTTLPLYSQPRPDIRRNSDSLP